MYKEIEEMILKLPNVRNCKKHYSIRFSEEDMFTYRYELKKIMQLLPELPESEWFNVRVFGSDEWANWMIDLHNRKSKK